MGLTGVLDFFTLKTFSDLTAEAHACPSIECVQGATLRLGEGRRPMA